ncbi:CsbD family protein [Methylobacterium sp. WL8]|nr:CsbD family protein [Methylobacterium sp. WL8]
MVNARKSTDTSEKTRGSIMEAIGKLVGDPKVEAEGKSKQKLSKPEAKLKPTPTA